MKNKVNSKEKSKKTKTVISKTTLITIKGGKGLKFDSSNTQA